MEERSMKIVTHNGVFHADDSFAVASLSIIFDTEVIRTRDSKVIETGDIVVDVGEIHNPSTGRFDHHQKGGAGKRPNGVPFASAGLVWAFYGPAICREVLGEYYGIDFHKVSQMVDDSLIAGIDARDNGVKTHHGINNANAYTVSDVISSFNPNWYAHQVYDGPFHQSVEIAKIILVNEIRRVSGQVMAETEVLKMVEPQKGNKIIILEKFVPWSNTIPLTEPQCLYVVYPDVSGTWRVQATPVGVGKDSFELKAALPSNWRGVKPDELKVVTNCDDAIFCHNSGFIMGTKTREGATHCAELALQLHLIAQGLK